MFELPSIPTDTSPEVRSQMIDLLRAMPLEKKLMRAAELSSFLKAFIESDIRANFPLESNNQIKKRLAFRLYGKEVGEQVARYLGE